ncbi:hypothetical protein JOB18_016610 [Solea senegalensis]|uniref:Uncharacterized protein n=1 Tax=Solea senegalensis TaxID=28829 RepID=A0AAV6QBN1_SOLSE|nr:hypothetical protein JOB18_016610 [Solea senegalensis]
MRTHATVADRAPVCVLELNQGSVGVFLILLPGSGSLVWRLLSFAALRCFALRRRRQRTACQIDLRSAPDDCRVCESEKIRALPVLRKLGPCVCVCE